MQKEDSPEWPDEPEGWRQLQELAQRETDPRKLAAIIDEMNKLLAERERGGGKSPGPPKPGAASATSSTLRFD